MLLCFSPGSTSLMGRILVSPVTSDLVKAGSVVDKENKIKMHFVMNIVTVLSLSDKLILISLIELYELNDMAKLNLKGKKVLLKCQFCNSMKIRYRYMTEITPHSASIISLWSALLNTKTDRHTLTD